MRKRVRGIASLPEVAAHLNLSERRVNQLASEGLPKIAVGKYDLVACSAWYIRFLQEELRRRGPRGTKERENANTGLASEKARLVKLTADTREHELKLARRQTIRIEDAMRELDRILFRLRGGVTGMPGKYAPRFTGLATVPEAQARLEQVADDLMLDLQRAAAEEDPDEDLDEEPGADAA